MSAIRLHREFGVNPTMPVCFWCGKDTGEIALLGAAYKGEAPRSMVMNYEPCVECKATMSLGICVAEATSDNKPTGRWVVVTEDCAKRLFEGWPMLENVLKLRRVHVGRMFMDAIAAQTTEIEAGEKP